VRYEFVLPDLGEGVTEGEVVEWLIEVGAEVAEDAPMVEVLTDKATVEIPCPIDGVVLELKAAPGDRVTVGSPLIAFETGDRGAHAVIAEDRSAASSDAQAREVVPAEPAAYTDALRQPASGVKATPAARRIARDLGIELSSLTGSGPRGAITDADVRAAIDPGPASGARGGEMAEPGRRKPLRGVRRRIAERLTRSHREVPKVTVVEECDFTELTERRGGLSLVPYAIQAAVHGLKRYPELNATLAGDEIIYFERYDIGVAVQGPNGLCVPVLRGADSMSLKELDAELKRLAESVRDDTASPADLRGSTFTITSPGRLGGLFATPLVNLGEAAILGVHRIAPRPTVRDQEIVIREIGLLSCSFDHRISDGTRATMFLLDVIDQLQGEALPD
jgi:pyruvate dehydrogenase E2 component (dihydrolipoamide acetyltransferase)